MASAMPQTQPPILFRGFSPGSGARTMRKEEVLAELKKIGLVPVLRASSVEKALALATAIADGGVTVLEVTMNVPGAIEVMRCLAQDRPDILIGAGTVLDP